MFLGDRRRTHRLKCSHRIYDATAAHCVKTRDVGVSHCEKPWVSGGKPKSLNALNIELFGKLSVFLYKPESRLRLVAHEIRYRLRGIILIHVHHLNLEKLTL